MRASLLQFADSSCDLQLFTRVRFEEEMERIVARAAAEKALVVFTVVSHAHREILRRLCDEHHVESVDLIGALIAKLGQYLGARPKGVPGLMHTIGDDYFRRIEAVEFTVKNDDGAEPRSLTKADLVLVGVSRTSKTPLSTFLAQKGYKTSNVPLVYGIDPPEELWQVEEDRIFGLTIRVEELLRIRQARLRHLGMPGDASYGQREHVAREIAWAHSIFRAHPAWPVIDMTGKAIEETAADILRIRRDRELRRLGQDKP